MRVILTSIFLLATNIIATAQEFSIASPKTKKSLLQVFLNKEGEIKYKFSRNGKTIIEESGMGFELANTFNGKKEKNLYSNFQISKIDSLTINEDWNPVWGEVKTINNNYNQLIIDLKEKGENPRILKIVFRVFEEGIGFRYEFPPQDNLKHFTVLNELTQFNLSGDHKAFWLPGDYDTNEYPPYTSKLSEVANLSSKADEIFAKTPIGGNSVQIPLMMKTNDGMYINIHEAALINYPAMNLDYNTTNNILSSHLVPDAIGNKAYLYPPAVTPWRTIIASSKAEEILESKMILNLNDPSVIGNTSFIKPMKYIGIWWEMHLGKSTWDLAGGQVASQDGNTNTNNKPKHGATTQHTKEYIDFAAQHGFGGVLVEGWNTGWEDWFGQWKEDVFDFVTPYRDYDLVGLNRYAKSKGVGIITHHETSASATNYERWMDTAYRQMAKLGSPAFKSGYVGKIIPRGEHHDGQWMVNHYLRSASKSASYNLMMVAHEPVRPTGLHRTYPNWMACEAARGNEFNAWSSGNKPEHETILPFTRLMGGPMDYTPGIFKIKYKANEGGKVHTTLAKQLALYVTLYSPIQMAADLIENYETKMDAFQFIKDVAVDWDDTKILNAEPGEYITIARKAKNTENWFIGSITDENSRDLNIDFSFLNPNQKYELTIYKDAADAHWDKNPEAYVIEKKTITNKTKLQYHLAEGGGCAISIMAIK